MKVLICLSTVLACTVSVCFASHAMIHINPEDLQIGVSFTVTCMGTFDNKSKVDEMGTAYELKKDDQSFYVFNFATNRTERHVPFTGINDTQLVELERGSVQIKDPSNATLGLYACYFTYRLEDGGTQTDNATHLLVLHTEPPHKGDASLRAFSFACIAIVMLKFLL